MPLLRPSRPGGRGLLTAVVAALAAASYLGVSGGEWFHVRQCRHHQMPAGAEHGPVVSAGADAHGDSHHRGDHGDHDEGHGPCICVGACHSTAASNPSHLVRAPALALPAGGFEPLSPLKNDGPPSEPSPYLLPFPNGPPPRA